jgi:hypothetical protein
MTAYSRGKVIPDSWLKFAAGVVVGILAMQVIIVALGFGAMPLLARPESIFLDLGVTILALGISLFGGGYIGRLTAGPRPAAGWIGGGMVIILFIVGLVLPDPGHYLNYSRDRGWTYIGKSQDIIPKNAKVVHDYTVPMTLAFVIGGTALACLGDWVAMRRLGGRGEGQPGRGTTGETGGCRS